MNSIIKEDIKNIVENFDGWEKFTNKTILISGANGFLSAYLVESFLALDERFNTKVIALVRNEEKAKKRFTHHLKNPLLKFIISDVSDEVKIEEINDKIDFIIHAASQASPKFYGIDPVGTLSANVLGTINLLNLARKNNVESFLYFSSGEVYGEVKEKDIPIKESTFGYLDCTNVRACYAESKRMGENICVSYCKQYGVKAKIVRPFHTYGPGMDLKDGRVFADFVANIVNKQNIILKSDGSASRAFCYLTDATLGFLNILVNGENAQAYNVGNPYQEYGIVELANILVNLFPEYNLKVTLDKSKQTNDYLKSPVNRNSPDIEKIGQLGWRPNVTVEDGFKRAILSYL
jgi:nucleoside-diphosphate-sugar epimerase